MQSDRWEGGPGTAKKRKKKKEERQVSATAETLFLKILILEFRL